MWSEKCLSVQDRTGTSLCGLQWCGETSFLRSQEYISDFYVGWWHLWPWVMSFHFLILSTCLTISVIYFWRLWNNYRWQFWRRRKLYFALPCSQRSQVLLGDIEMLERSVSLASQNKIIPKKNDLSNVCCEGNKSHFYDSYEKWPLKTRSCYLAPAGFYLLSQRFTIWVSSVFFIGESGNSTFNWLVLKLEV